MEKIHLVHLFYSVLLLCFIRNCSSQEKSCHEKNDDSGEISQSDYNGFKSICWTIKVPGDTFARIDIQKLEFQGYPCSHIYLKISVTGMEKSFTFCSHDEYQKPLTVFNDVNITYYHSGRSSYGYNYGFELQYTRGVIDFSTGLTYGINWLKEHQTNFGWGRDTHRAITALYLANEAQFLGNKMEEEVMVKQLQLKMAIALLRNSTDSMSVNELSMYVNALTVTCHSDRNFFSYDLLKNLADRAFSALSPSPGAYLTLCNAKWPLTSSNVQTLLEHLEKDTEYQFHTEIQAMTVLALSCIKDRTDLFNDYNDTYVYNSTVGNLMTKQREDGSFGNPHTTAIVTQALIASGEKFRWRWNVTSALQFLIKDLNSSSVDFLSVYLTLPLLKWKTLADIGRVHCKDNYRKVDKDDDIVDVIDEIGGSNHVQFSLYIGDNKDIVHTVYLRVPDNSTAYDVMKIAQVADPKYKFSYLLENDHVYIYKIAGISNDIETGKYWLFYSQSPHGKEMKHYTSSPDQIIVGKNEHFIMWYRIAHI